MKNIEVQNEGKKIVLPEGMTYDKAIDWLQKKKTEDERVVQFIEQFEGAHPLDALVAFHKALAEIYGWVDLIPTPGFFGDRPPTMVPVRVGVNQTLHIAYGLVQTSDATIQTQMKFQPKPLFMISGNVRQKVLPEMKKVAEKTREILRTDSIFKGKAFKVNWNWVREERTFDPAEDAPRFLDLNSVNENELVFSDEVYQQLNVGLWTPIEHSASLKLHGVPLRRGILLSGPFGVGKTLTALVTAKKAVENGWTFIYLDSVADLEEGLRFARQYAPAVIFAEDIDRLVNGQERTHDIDNILNVLDGLDSKNHEIITVLTTNNISAINRAFIRHGRIDDVVFVTPPDADAAVKLVKIYGRGLVNEDTNWQRVGKALAGKIPAAIREVVERAKLSTISRLDGGTIAGSITEEDLLYAARTIEAHVQLIEGTEKKPDAKTISLHLHLPSLEKQEVERGLVPALNDADYETAFGPHPSND